jgi:hypothetical protein
MLDPINFSINETINSVYYTKSQIDSKGYLTSIPAEHVTDTELNNKGSLTSIPAEYVTDTELNNKGYLTSIPAEYVTDTELSNDYYNRTQVQALAGTNMTWNSTSNKFDVTVPASQWTTTGNEIYYGTGKIGIGLINPSATGSTLHVT